MGDAGVDQLTGGYSADTFWFSDVTDSGVGAGNRDIITDWDTGGTGDKINLSDFAGTMSFIGNTGFGGNANEVN